MYNLYNQRRSCSRKERRCGRKEDRDRRTLDHRRSLSRARRIFAASRIIYNQPATSVLCRARARARQSLCVWYKVRCVEIRYDPIDGPLFLPVQSLTKYQRGARQVLARRLSGAKFDALGFNNAFNNAQGDLAESLFPSRKLATRPRSRSIARNRSTLSILDPH